MRIKKIFEVLSRGIIKKTIYIDKDLYIRLYTKYLEGIGIIFSGSQKKVKYIDPSVYFDGTDYSMIYLGDNITISREVMLLIHDYSVNAAMCSIGVKIDRNEGEIFFKKAIQIGDNTFIGARVSVLPGTTIGKNCIIGAGAVIKGNVPDNSIVVGNPWKIIGQTDEFAEKHRLLCDYETENSD